MSDKGPPGRGRGHTFATAAPPLATKAMGAGASASAARPSFEDVSQWSKEDVGEHVAAIGEAFEPYKDIAIKNDIDGETLLDIDDEDLEAFGIALKPHRKKIMKKVGDLKAGAASADPAAASELPRQPSATTVASAAPRRVLVGVHVDQRVCV